jgi:hypothetical protein
VPELFDIDVRCNQGPIVRQLVRANIGMEISPWDLPCQIPQLSEELRENQNEAPEEGNEVPTPFRLYYLATLVFTSYMEWSFLFDSFKERTMFLGTIGESGT